MIYDQTIVILSQVWYSFVKSKTEGKFFAVFGTRLRMDRRENGKNHYL